MSEDLARTLELPLGSRFAEPSLTRRRRVARGLRHPTNQRQLIRFLCVGASGYFVNTASYWIFIHVAFLDYRLAFVASFLLGGLNNFVWNRHWTFQALHEHPVRQAVRFFLVSLLVFGFAYGVMMALVHTIVAWKVAADALAWIIVTPVSFLVQKLWSFKA